MYQSWVHNAEELLELQIYVWFGKHIMENKEHKGWLSDSNTNILVVLSVNKDISWSVTRSSFAFWKAISDFVFLLLSAIALLLTGSTDSPPVTTSFACKCFNSSDFLCFFFLLTDTQQTSYISYQSYHTSVAWWCNDSGIKCAIKGLRLPAVPM